MSVEISSVVVGFNGGGGGGGMIDPSNLHLKKELTQIRKAARVLRDPGTSSSWRSPINSVRSLTKDHYVHCQKNGKIDASEQFVSASSNIKNNGNDISDKGNVKDTERKKVSLYNWRSLKSESERSKQNDKDDNGKEEGSFATQDEGVDLDSLSDANNNGINVSISDKFTDRYSSGIFRCKDKGFTPPIRRAIKKKPKRSSYGGHDKMLQRQIIWSSSKENIDRDDDSIRLVDRSDDTEDYGNSEDERSVSALSLLAELRKKGWAYSPRKLLRSQKKEYDSVSCSTSALSLSSYRKYSARNPSVVESWDATTRSMNEASDDVDDQLDFPGEQGCGIPCYWSRRSTPRSRIGQGSCCSPSPSDTLRRKGKSILCGTQSIHQSRGKNSSLSSNRKRPTNSRAVGHGLVVPLLTNSSGTNSDDEIVNFGVIDLEALSRLDGRRWSTSCRSQEGLELVALNGETHGESSPEDVRSLSHKYRPMFFDEFVGQRIVVQFLKSTVSRRRIAPVYLFHGPRGTGKTSMAIIFAASLNCLASGETKPCGVCRECADFISGKSKRYGEVDVSNKKGNENFKALLKNMSVVQTSAFPIFKVFLVKECHLLPSKAWQAFLRLLEKPMPRVIFILETTDADNVPRAVLSRCQKHLFNKISSSDIVSKMKTIVHEENLDVLPEALELIASNSDGSLHDAETMIDQLRLFGKRITLSLVNELIGVVSDEKLLDLLESAMSSNATETVVKARELMDSGVDPIVLTSQLATLIVDIIAGTPTHPNVSSKHDSFFGGRNLSERELDRLRHALTLLSEAEKHIRISSERCTWFTATLLQLGSLPLPDRTHSGSSRRQSSKTSEEDHRSSICMHRENKPRKDSSLATDEASSPKSSSSNLNYRLKRRKMSGDESLTDVWLQCIEKCHSRTLRELLHLHGKLVSLSDVKGGFVAYLAFEDSNMKTRAEGFLSSITNSFETVLHHNVEVSLILVNNSRARTRSQDLENTTVSEIPVQRIESIIREQMLETAWLQEMEKGTCRSVSQLRPERNQVLPRDGSNDGKEFDFPTQKWEDEMNREIKALKISDGIDSQQKENMDAKRADHYPISPSLLHDNSHYSKDNLGYESESRTGSCSGMFCWKNARPLRRTNLVAKPDTSFPLRQQKSGRISWFGECAKPRRSRPQGQR